MAAMYITPYLKAGWATTKAESFRPLSMNLERLAHDENISYKHYPESPTPVHKPDRKLIWFIIFITGKPGSHD